MDHQSIISYIYAEGRIRVILIDGVAQFALSFFCQGNTCASDYLFGIFILNGKLPPVVWSATRDYPVQYDAKLNFAATGEVVLRDADGRMVWTTNTAGKSVVGMNLADSGNLVLYDSNHQVVGQSFDHPTDCLLPGQPLFQGHKLIPSVLSTNWTAQKGMYALQVTDKGLFAYLDSNPPQAYFSNMVSGKNETKGNSYARWLNGSLDLFINSVEPSNPDYNISISPASSAQYMQLMPDGHLKVFEF